MYRSSLKNILTALSMAILPMFNVFLILLLLISIGALHPITIPAWVMGLYSKVTDLY